MAVDQFTPSKSNRRPALVELWALVPVEQPAPVQPPAKVEPPRVGQHVWLTVEIRRADGLYSNYKDDEGIVISSPTRNAVTVLFRNRFEPHVRNRVVKPTYENCRARVPMEFLRLTDPKPRSLITGPDPLRIELATLRDAHPGIVAKELHELVLEKVSPAPSLSLVKKALSRLAVERRCLLKIPIDVLEALGAALPINDLLALTATCRELRKSLEDVRLTRTGGLIEKYHDKMWRDSWDAKWNRIHGR